MGLRQVVDELQEIVDTAVHLVDSQAHMIQRASEAIVSSLAHGHKILLFGNGGSAAAAQHLAAEFVGRFRLERCPFPALALTADSAALTAIANDYGFDMVFERQVRALGCPGDVAIGISTSGESLNVLHGICVASDMGLTTIALTGGDGGALAKLAAIPIIAPAHSTPRIQECHVAIGHILCEVVESAVAEGTAPTEATLVHRLNGSAMPGKKVKTWTQLNHLCNRWRREGKRVVWTNGCFDLLHTGHLHSLRAARRFGDVLIVGVNDDQSVRRIKGRARPIVPAIERAELVGALECVDAVVIFEQATPEKALARLKPDVHCKGAEYADANGRNLPENLAVATYGGRIEFVPMLPNISTTALIKRIREVAVHDDRQ